MEVIEPGRLWVVQQPLTFFNMDVGTRMTVLRLSHGGLLLHSPTELTEEVEQQLWSLGEVRYIVAPNRLHHLFVDKYVETFPEALLYGTKTLLHKRKDLPWSRSLETLNPPPWDDEFRMMAVRGSSLLDEFVFCDERSGVLVLTDLIQHHDQFSNPLQRLVSRLLGTYKRYSVPQDLRWSFGNRRKARESMRRMLSWNFDRIILAHGPLVYEGGRKIFTDAMNWLD